MAVVKNLMTRAGFDASGMRKGVKQGLNDLRTFKRGVSTAMKGIAAALAASGIGLGIRSATKEAMDFEASLQQINRMMGENARQFNAWVRESASGYGMARSEATKYGAVFGNLISGFASGTKQTAQYTVDLLKAAAVISSSTGRTIEDTMDRIRSGMLGSTEAIEDLGINVNISMIEATNAFKKFAGSKSWQQLDFQTQQTVRYFAILEQAASKYGTEISKNANSDQAKFIAQMKNVKLYLGQAFLPIYTTILPALTRFATSLANVMQAVAQFSQTLFGYKDAQQQVGDQTNAVTGLGDAYEEAGKKAKKSVSGFDKLNLIGGESGSDDAGGAASAATDADGGDGPLTGMAEQMDVVSAKAQEMAIKVKDAIRGIKEFIQANKEPIIASLAGMTAGFTAFWLAANGGAIATSAKTALVGIIPLLTKIHPVVLIIAAVIAALTAAFIYFYRTNEQFRDTVHSILSKIGEVASWLWNDVMKPFGAWVTDVFISAWDGLSAAVKWLYEKVLTPLGKAFLWIWNEVLVPIGEFLIWLRDHVFAPLGRMLMDVVSIGFRTLASIAGSLWKNILVPMGNFIKTIFVKIFETVANISKTWWGELKNVFDALLKLKNMAMVPINAFIESTFKPTIDKLIKVFEFLWNKVLKPLATYFAGEFAKGFDNATKGIGNMIKNLENIFVGILTFIEGVFTANWSKAWEGIKGIFINVFDLMAKAVNAPLNLIIDAINAVIGGINKFKIDIPDWVGKIPGIPDGASSIGFNIPKIPKLDVGTNYVQKAGLAFLHEGEAVVPKEYNPAAGGNDETNRLLRQLLQAMRDGRVIITEISQTKIGQSSSAYQKNYTRMSGSEATGV